MKKIIIGILALTTAAITAHAGWEFTSTTKAEGGRHADKMGNAMKGTLDGQKAKFEFTQGSNPMMGTGSYMVTEDGGKTMYIVHPDKKTYSLFDLKSMMGMAGGIMGMMNMQVKDPKVEKLLDESGDKILGYRTTHYKFKTTYTMTMNIFGMTRATDTIQEQEMWTTTALKDAVNAFRSFQQGMKSGNEELDKLIAAETEKAQGFPLKTITTHTTKDSNGKSEITRTTMEVTDLKSASPSASVFKIPAGYQEVSMLGAAAADGSSGTNNAANGTQQANPAASTMKLLQGLKKPE